MASTQHIEAKNDIKPSASEWSNEDTAIVLGIIVPAVVILSYFWFRKPLKEERFDKKELKNGTWKERLNHAWYFFADKIVGWPYKAGKEIYKLKGGLLFGCLVPKHKLVFSHSEPDQKHAGALGYFQAYVLYLPMSILKYIIMGEEDKEFYVENKNKKPSHLGENCPI